MIHSEYDFKSHYLPVRGVRLHYLDEGRPEGEPVVMVHGNPTWSFFYRKLVRALRHKYRAIVPDHIGMGLSDKPPEGAYAYTLKSRVEDFEHLLEHLQLSAPLTLVVHDWGGLIGLHYATRFPERIARVVIMNTAAFHLLEEQRLPGILSFVRLPVVGPLFVQGGNAFLRGALDRCVVRKMPPEVRRAYLAPYNRWKNRRAILRFVQDIPRRPRDPAYGIISDVAARLPVLQRFPTLIAWGMRDFIFDEHYLNRWRSICPHADVCRYEQAGHWLLEDAGDEIAQRVVEFFGRHPVRAS